MTVLAIDPGPVESAWCLCRDAPNGPLLTGLLTNNLLIDKLRSNAWDADALAVEMIASYGMPVGEEVFGTVLWIGRFIEAWGREHTLVKRLECKLHLCHDSRAKDANIRQALIDKLGAPGTKKAPGRTYGVSGHGWSALAVAITVSETYDWGAEDTED